MTEGTRRDKWAAADAARNEAKWGMRYVPDEQQPVDAAKAALERGDLVFQVDIPITMYQGTINVGSSWSRTWRPEPYDHIGAIERLGWRLAHMSTCFVSRGASINTGGTAEQSIHGDIVGVYVFRRGG